jgi:hypothetical protein
VTRSAILEAITDEATVQSPHQEIHALISALLAVPTTSVAPSASNAQEITRSVHEVIGARQLDIEILIDMGAEKFTGSHDPRVAQEWIQETQKCMKYIELTDEQMVINAVLLLRGQAYQWWQTVLSSYPAIEVISWNVFMTEFKKKYFPCWVSRYAIPEASVHEATDESHHPAPHGVLPTAPIVQLTSTPRKFARWVGDLLPMKRLFKLQVETFTGSLPHDPEAAQAWIQDTERMMMLLNFTNKQMVNKGIFLVRDNAYTWWKSELRRLPDHDVISWEVFKREFSNRYCPGGYLDANFDGFHDEWSDYGKMVHTALLAEKMLNQEESLNRNEYM